jgi:hypothetical protein
VTQGEKDNRQITVLSPHHFINATTEEESPSEDQKRVLMLLTHDHPTAGHLGCDETIRRAKKLQRWERMNKWVANYVKGCATC